MASRKILFYGHAESLFEGGKDQIEFYKMYLAALSLH